MPLNQLFPNTAFPTNIQETDLSIDVLGRFACNTVDEALASGPFDVIIVGSGMYGGYTASKLRRKMPNLRILVLEAGPFLISEHVQNLSRIGYDIFSTVSGTPYVSGSQHNVAGHYYCVGGKSLGWGKWSPRMTDADLQQWPEDLADYLRNNYTTEEKDMGVTPREDFIYGEFADKLGEHIGHTIRNFPQFNDCTMELAPIAAQSKAPSSGLYSFDAYSSVITLIDAVRGDINESGVGNDLARKLMIVPRARALKILFNGDRAHSILVSEGRRQNLREIPVAQGGKIMLALGSMETTRLVLNSVDHGQTSNLAGRNLMAHLRSNFNVRIHRSEIGLDLGKSLQPAAFHVQGDMHGRRYHYQILAAADNTHRVESVLYRMVPDMQSLDAMMNAQKADWVTLRILTIGEMQGFPDMPIRSPDTYWCDLSPYESDSVAGQVIPKLYAHWDIRQEDDVFWTFIDGRAIDLAKALVNNPANIEFQQLDGTWSANPLPVNSFRDSLGSTFHEAGTLWMGNDPAISVTDTNGKLHEFQNLYALDQSIFPTVGSANPVLTGLTICKKIVESL